MAVRLLLILLLSSSFSWAQNRCENLFTERSEKRLLLRDVNLAEYFVNEVAGKSAEDIAAMNEKTIKDIEAEVPYKVEGGRKSSISLESAEFLRNQILENPVVSPWSNKYDQQGVSIGYCFGRATFVHMMLLKMGVQKASIQKIWAVGSMKAGGIMWQFHVATMAYTEAKGWVVIDSNHMNPLPVREWIAHYAKQSEDGRVRFYATDASKFAFEIGKYSRVQMGLDMTSDKDWYKNYFKDMFEWLKTKEVTENSVKTMRSKTTADEKTANNSFVDMWRSIVEFMR